MTPMEHKLKYLNDIDHQIYTINRSLLGGGMYIVHSSIKKGAKDAIDALEKTKKLVIRIPVFNIGDNIEIFTKQYKWLECEIVDIEITEDLPLYTIKYKINNIEYFTKTVEKESFRRVNKKPGEFPPV